MTMAESGATNPAAGVIATKPMTIAVACPTAVTLLPPALSSTIHTDAVAMGASKVLANARPAVSLAAKALPALNPNQPTQRSEAPSKVNGILWGKIGCRR